MAIILVMLVVGLSLLKNSYRIKANFKALALVVRHYAAIVVAYYQGRGITPQHLSPHLNEQALRNVGLGFPQDLCSEYEL